LTKVKTLSVDGAVSLKNPLDGAIATDSSYCSPDPSYSGDKILGYLCKQCHKDD